MTLSNEGQFIQLKADAVGEETGLKPRRSKIALLVSQLLCQPKGFKKDGFTVSTRSNFFEGRIMNLSAGMVIVNEFLLLLADGKHTGLVQFVTMIKRSKIH